MSEARQAISFSPLEAYWNYLSWLRGDFSFPVPGQDDIGIQGRWWDQGQGSQRQMLPYGSFPLINLRF